MDKDAKCLSPSAIVSFLGKHNIKLRTVQRTQQQKWRNLCSNSDWWNSTLLSGNWLANQAPINKLMMQNEEIFFYKIEKTWIKYHCLDKKQCSTQVAFTTEDGDLLWHGWCLLPGKYMGRYKCLCGSGKKMHLPQLWKTMVKAYYFVKIWRSIVRLLQQEVQKSRVIVWYRMLQTSGNLWM